jgi:hypothetical protein
VLPTLGEPTTKIAELYGQPPGLLRDSDLLARRCPFRVKECDVTANRHQTAVLHQQACGDDWAALQTKFGEEPLPLGVCSCWTRRRNETEAKPWILCNKRLLYVEAPRPRIPASVRELIPFAEGTSVGVWPEFNLKFDDPTSGSSDFFDFTFDFLLMEVDAADQPVGPPYIIETMAASTRGKGTTEHTIDVLLGRPQRQLAGVVDSIYTPNYRQVFSRFLTQFIAKSEVAELWGGRTIWVVQDALLDYIMQTTAFRPTDLLEFKNPNVFLEVFGLEKVDPNGDPATTPLRLTRKKRIEGRTRLHIKESPDFTSLLGLAQTNHPPVESLRKRLAARSSNGAGRWFKFRWGDFAEDETR